MAIELNTPVVAGGIQINGVYHGSRMHYEKLAADGYHSVGIHFGDISQARYFAGAGGQILRCNLRFRNLLDVKNSDLGWTSELIVATGLKLLMATSVGIIPEEFDKILKNTTHSLAEIRVPRSIDGEGAKRLVELIDAHGFDGIKYTNRNEPPGRVGGVAYFVLRGSQVDIVDRDAPVSGKFDDSSESNLK